MAVQTVSKCVKIGSVGLTVREALFVDAYIKNGGNASMAIQEAVPKYREKKYKGNMVRVMGYEELAKPQIRLAIQARLEMLALNKGYVASKFFQLSNDKDSKEIQLRATKELGNIIGVYADGGPKSSSTNVNVLFNFPAGSENPRGEVIEVKAENVEKNENDEDENTENG